ncbi:MAG: hypothetical protein AAGU27_21685 [Dehalobacterium sp.]
MPLPANATTSCQQTGNPYMLAGGLYHGGLKSTVFINSNIPFNLADLLYVVSHESYPGHIAEAMLKDIHLVKEQGYIEQQIQFMLSPQFVITEGLGLLAEEIIFPGDEAQAWLTDNIFKEYNICPDGSNLAAIHHAKNVLWGAWGNAALLAAEGRSDSEIKDYLSQWALLNEQELQSAIAIVKGGPYIFCYYYGWQLLRSWINAVDRQERIRRLLTQQLLPADITCKQSQ